MDGWMDGWMAGWLDGWMAGWMDGWMDKKTRKLLLVAPDGRHVVCTARSSAESAPYERNPSKIKRNKEAEASEIGFI